jgi:hypothetical protein
LYQSRFEHQPVNLQDIPYNKYGRSIYVLTCANEKMRPVEIIPEIEGGIKENSGGGEFNYDIF